MVAPDVAVEVLEALAAERRLVEFEALDHRAHGAVEHQDALRAAAARRFAWGRRVRHRSGGFCAPRAKAEQVADREHEVRAVHGVEVKVSKPCLASFAPGRPPRWRRPACGSRGRRRGLRTCPPARPARVVPARVTKLRAWLKLCVGMMPGTIGMSMPRRAHPVEVAEVGVVVEEHLADRASRRRRPCLEHVDVGVDARLSGCSPDSGHRDLDVGDAVRWRRSARSIA